MWQEWGQNVEFGSNRLFGQSLSATPEGWSDPYWTETWSIWLSVSRLSGIMGLLSETDHAVIERVSLACASCLVILIWVSWPLFLLSAGERKTQKKQHNFHVLFWGGGRFTGRLKMLQLEIWKICLFCLWHISASFSQRILEKMVGVRACGGGLGYVPMLKKITSFYPGAVWPRRFQANPFCKSIYLIAQG